MTIETKEAARIGYDGFFFRMSRWSSRCGKRNPLFPIQV